jgi:hypothetical protein
MCSVENSNKGVLMFFSPRLIPVVHNGGDKWPRFVVEWNNF